MKCPVVPRAIQPEGLSSLRHCAPLSIACGAFFCDFDSPRAFLAACRGILRVDQENAMRRPPIFPKTMTATERKRRQRAGLTSKQLREEEAKRRAKAKARREARSAALWKAAVERKPNI